LKVINRVKPAMKFLLAGLATASFQMAFSQTAGLWDYEIKNDFYAGTTNDSSNTFGQQCATSDKTCRYFVGMPSSCQDKVSYPALVNSDGGAFHARLLCVGRVGKYNLYHYVFEDFANIDSAVKNSARIGIAVPMENSEVMVLRFSLDGALAAITRMRGAADHANGN
jgi:hypothetical protein